ncbi:cytochrome c oxidase subunit 3 [Aeoliella sp. SH292]|uniref:cytochrome c oxidase subunit 3 n=1 Tax=Aeoliella sp. SH292 TaxID=3454464 RepID=UPI003F9DC25F
MSHAHDEHHPFQAHHFDTIEQQFQAGKLAMWLFLATEVLFFSGMFVAYAAFRASNPELFDKAAQFLNPTLGAGNTVVLLLSSLTVAWAVRCAQTNQQRGLLINLLITLVCAGIFMGVKSVEYSLKFKEGLYWRGMYSYVEGSHPDLTGTHAFLDKLGIGFAIAGAVIIGLGLVLGAGSVGRRWGFFALGLTVLGAAAGCLAGNAYTSWYEKQHPHGEHAADAAHDHGADHAHDEHAEPLPDQVLESAPIYGGQGPQFPGVFFSIYYAMTGVHAIHILAGIGVFVWIVSRAARQHFEPTYYGPVEYTGLYWHLVDLIWIYLFPLLYLI